MPADTPPPSSAPPLSESELALLRSALTDAECWRGGTWWARDVACLLATLDAERAAHAETRQELVDEHEIRLSAERGSELIADDLEKMEAERDTLRADLAARTAKCVNEHADAALLVEWLGNPTRTPAATAFTAGPERQIADVLETVLDAMRARLGEVENTLDRAEGLVISQGSHISALETTLREVRDDLAKIKDFIVHDATKLGVDYNAHNVEKVVLQITAPALVRCEAVLGGE